MSASAKKKLRKEQNSAQLTEKQLKAQKEAKKLKIYTSIFVIAIAIVLVAGIAIAGINFYKNSGVAEKHTIAAKIGDHEMNSVELSYYYTDLVTSNYSQWSSTYGDSLDLYMSFMGLDLSQPLDEQEFSEGVTWADYFIESAAEQAKSDYLLCQKANAEGYTLSEEDQLELDNAISQLSLFAAVYGYADANSYLRGNYGPGANEDSYYDYCLQSTLASSYYNAHVDSLNIDDAAVRAYEADHFDEFSSFSYATYRFNYNDYLTGGTEDENGTVTYSEEEQNAAREAAKADATNMAACATVEELNAAIAALAINEGASKKCTEYTNSLYAATSTLAREWLTADERKSGDFTILPSETTVTNEDGTTSTVINDYYAVLFLERNDNTMHLANIRHILAGFENGTTDENGNTVYSDESKAAAKAEAEEILNQFLAGTADEASFAALATEKTDDTASASTGGLYEDITPEQGIYVEEFTNWAVDPERKAGDTGIIETSYGYHVMYYVADDEMTYRDYMITNQIMSETMEAWYNEILATAEVTVEDTSRMNKSIVLSN